jgi:hypothetical protein
MAFNAALHKPEEPRTWKASRSISRSGEWSH